MCIKWAQKGKGEGPGRSSGGTCRLAPKALPTLIQVHHAERCPACPARRRIPQRLYQDAHNGSPPLPSPDQRVSGIKSFFFFFLRKTSYIILSGITLFFYFQCFYSKIHVIIYCRLDKKSGYADTVLFYDLFYPQTTHATLTPVSRLGIDIAE